MTDNEGMIWQSYRYDVSGEMTFGKPQYNNVYSYNAESYNPNMDNQYLRARYYSVGTGDFMTEDSYLGNTTDPLSLNRYNYTKSSPLNYVDPSGHLVHRKWSEKKIYEMTSDYYNEEAARSSADDIANFLESNVGVLIGGTAMAMAGVGLALGGITQSEITKTKIRGLLKQSGINIDLDDIAIHNMDKMPKEIYSNFCITYINKRKCLKRLAKKNFAGLLNPVCYLSKAPSKSSVKMLKNHCATLTKPEREMSGGWSIYLQNINK